MARLTRPQSVGLYLRTRPDLVARPCINGEVAHPTNLTTALPVPIPKTVRDFGISRACVCLSFPTASSYIVIN